MHLVAILHDIRSIHNVGSIFRTADGAGFEKLYLCGITPSPTDRFGKIRPDFAKVALGAEKSVAWESISDIRDFLKRLKKEGWTILALEQSKRAVSLMAEDLMSDISKDVRCRQIALVVGNEVEGIPPAILKLADTVIEIPMLGKKESLNVSVAFGIAAYQLRFL